MEGPTEEERQEPRRPRVVDKRVSSRAVSEPPPETAAPEQAGPSRSGEPRVPPQATETGQAPSPGEAGPPDPRSAEPLWTPEQEEQARRVAQEIRETPSSDWILNVAVTLANVAATKLDAGSTGDAGLAIDALAGIVEAVGPRLGDAGNALRQTVAQLQMAYTQVAAPPGPSA